MNLAIRLSPLSLIATYKRINSDAAIHLIETGVEHFCVIVSFSNAVAALSWLVSFQLLGSGRSRSVSSGTAAGTLVVLCEILTA